MWINQRAALDQDSSDFDRRLANNLWHAETTGGLHEARKQAMTNADEAFARQRDLKARIAAQPGMAPEVATRELANANASRIQAMSTIIGLRQQELSLVNQALAAEKQRTQAIKDQQQSIRASIGMADNSTLREAEAGAKAIREGRALTQSQVSALGSSGFGEVAQTEAAKLGEGALAKYPELAALAEQIRKSAEERSKEISVAIQQNVTGRITVTPDLEKTKADLTVILNQWSQETKELMQQQLELDRADRNSQDALRRNTSG